MKLRGMTPLLVAFSLARCSFADELGGANFFPLKAGCEWRYQTSGNAKSPKITQRVAKVESVNGDELARKETVVDNEVTGFEHVSCNATGLFQHRVNDVAIDPPMLVVRFPLKDGDRWQTKSKFGKQTVVVDNESILDEIEVPFGKLKAIKVTSKSRSEPNGQRYVTTTWFAPNIGMAKVVVKRVDVADSETTMVLEKFSTKKFLAE